jgi:uncharacterized protein YjbI with pentapeptide repeats
MKTYTKKELKDTLELHRKWLSGEKDGIRANLTKVDLRGVNLCGVDLRVVDLRWANLRAADLSGGTWMGLT